MLLLLPVAEKVGDHVVKALVRRAAGDSGVPVEASLRDHSQDGLGRRPVAPRDQQHPLSMRMQLVCPLEKVHGRHRGHVAGSEQDEHVRLGCYPQLIQPFERRDRRSLANDLITSGVAVGEFPLERFSISQILVHCQQDRLRHRASQGDQAASRPSSLLRRLQPLRASPQGTPH